MLINNHCHLQQQQKLVKATNIEGQKTLAALKLLKEKINGTQNES